jgi:DDE superfamily endonuclease
MPKSFFFDESGVQNGPNVTRGYSPKGQKPLLVQSGSRFRTNMASAVGRSGTLRFMFYDKTMNSQRIIEFCRRLLRDLKKKVLVIMDNLKVHHSKIFKAWLAKHKQQIEVFYLPAYAPDLNPDEYFNNCFKTLMSNGIKPRNQKQLKSKARGVAFKIQRNPEKVAKLFDHKCIAYAAQS